MKEKITKRKEEKDIGAIKRPERLWLEQSRSRKFIGLFHYLFYEKCFSCILLFFFFEIFY